MAVLSKKLPSLRFTVTAVLIGLVFITATAITCVLYLNARNTLLTSTQALLDQVAGRMDETIVAFLSPVATTVRLGVELARSGSLDPGDLSGLEALYFSQMSAQPELASMDFGHSSGHFLMVKRMPDSSLATKRLQRVGGEILSEWKLRLPGAALGGIHAERRELDDQYDPRLRPWYQGAEDKRDMFWTDVYVFATDGQPAITTALAIRGPDGAVQGVTSASISLKGLSGFLDDLEIVEGGVIFIIDRHARLIGMPGLLELLHGPGGRTELPHFTESGIPQFKKLAEMPLFAESLQRAVPTDFSFSVGDERFIGTLAPLSYPPGGGWMIGAVLPEDELLGAARQGNYKALLISLLLLLLSIVAAVYIARRITRPLQSLVNETDRIRNLEFSDRLLPNPTFKELSDTLQAFGDMKTGLRAFSKYVPTDLVRLLLESHEDPVPGGQIHELTLFFSDIRNFSTYAELNPPNEVADSLSEYLKLMTETVRRNQGTIDKLIGDGIMAFWNAPRVVDDHAYHAVRAALECLDAINAMNMPHLYTRIGIHTTQAVVGNFGSEERLNYTAIGDGVNLTARLEGVNKLYGTQLLISQETLERLDGRFECRMLDRIAVKGKSQPTQIYQVLGDFGKVDEAILKQARRYEEGLKAYFDRRFSEALESFSQLHSCNPEDLAVLLLMQRTETLVKSPPPPVWDGVYVLNTK